MLKTLKRMRIILIFLVLIVIITNFLLITLINFFIFKAIIGFVLISNLFLLYLLSHYLKIEEKALKELEELYLNAPNPLFRSTLDGKILLANNAFLETLKIKDENIENLNTKDFYFNKEDGEKLIKEILEKGSVKDKIIQLKRKDGKKIYIKGSSCVVKDNLGRPIFFDTSFTDITDEILTDELLDESRKKYETLFENVDTSIAILDKSNNVILANRSFEEHFADESDTTKSKMILDLIDENEKEKLEKVLKDYNESNFVLLSKDKKYFKGHISKIDEYNERIISLTDITDRVKLEKELKEKGSFLEMLFNSLKEPFFVLDKEQNVLIANNALFSFLKCNEDDIVGKKCFEVIHKGNSPSDCPFAELIQKEKRVTRTMTLEDKFFDCVLSPLYNDKGELQGAIHLLYDITDLIKANMEKMKLLEQIAQLQKFEAIENLAGGIAHDLNNLLTVMFSSLENIKSEAKENDKLLDSIFELETSIEKASKMTKSLLGFARQQIYKPLILNLNKYISKNLNIYKRLISENIEIEFYPDKNLKNLKIDPLQLEQIIVNILANAKDAIGFKSNGKIVIETKNVYVDQDYVSTHIYARVGNYVLLTISDNGCGMSYEEVSRIFEPFFTTKKQGTGLGMPVVFGIIKQNGGFINVYSEKNVGTTIRVYLPSVEQEEENIIPSTKEIDSSTKNELIRKKVIVVEDDPLILKILSTTLLKGGFEIKSFSHPKDVLENLESILDSSLLITDIIMPEMNGKELYNILKEKIPNLKVLFISGYSKNIISHDELIDEKTNLLEKPFSSKVLIEKVLEVLAKEDL